MAKIVGEWEIPAPVRSSFLLAKALRGPGKSVYKLSCAGGVEEAACTLWSL